MAAADEAAASVAVPWHGHRYVVSTGVEGFCDRLQSLLCTLSWSRKSGRVVVVNWRDEVWSGTDGSGGDFGDYFELYNRPGAVISHNPLLWASDLPPQLQATRDVFPPAWAGEPMRPGGKWLYGHTAARCFDARDHAPDPGTAVVVVPNIKYRTYHMLDFANHVRLRPWLATAWAARRAGLPPSYQAVHLRGTDRARTPAAAQATRKRLQELLRAAGACKLPVVVVGDDAELDAAWAAERPGDRRLHPASASARSVRRGEATHYERVDVLAKGGVTKRQLNTEALLDWLTLVGSAGKPWSTQPESLYYDMACRLRNIPSALRYVISALPDAARAGAASAADAPPPQDSPLPPPSSRTRYVPQRTPPPYPK